MNIRIDPIRLNERKCEVVEKLSEGKFLIGSYKNIEYLKGFGSFVVHTILVKLNDGSEKDVTADYIIIAAGSKPKYSHYLRAIC